MKNVIKSLVIASVPFVIAACGKSSNSNPVDNAREAAKNPEIQGQIYKRVDCIVTPAEFGMTAAGSIFNDEKLTIKSAREQYQFKGANVTHALVYYTSADCSGQEVAVYRQQGSVRSVDVKTKDGSKGIDINYDRLFVEPKTSEAVTYANDLKLCGIEDWAQNSEREVTTKMDNEKCSTLHSGKVETVVLNEGKALYLGKSVSGRPDSADKSVEYRY